MTNTLKYIMLAVFGNLILWSLIIPLWQFPDEQAHFAQVQNYVEVGGSPKGADLSQEIYESERLLGTLRDLYGINKYTYHNDYRIHYTDSTIGEFEPYIATLDRAARTRYIKTEEPRYPPLFYLITGLGYRATYTGSLFDRVWATRLISALIGLATVYAGFLLGRAVFPRSSAAQAATTLALGFHPMLTFVSSGINNDTLLNCLSTFLLYWLVRTVSQPVSVKHMFWLVLLFALGILTKQLMFLFAPTIAIALLTALVQSKPSKTTLLRIGGLGICGFGILVLFWVSASRGFWLPYWPSSLQSLVDRPAPYTEIIKSKALQLYRETFVWYWGVYHWLGLVLPIPVLRALKVVIGISGLGWLVALTKRLVLKRMLILLLANFFYIGILLAWDISQIRTQGFSHGLQGRYFFPLIGSHMVFLIAGFFYLLPKKLHSWLPWGVGSAMLSLNFLSLYRIMGSYYDLAPLWVFLNQASQYKPAFAKWPYIGIYLSAYLASLIIMIYQLLPGSKRRHEK